MSSTRPRGRPPASEVTPTDEEVFDAALDAFGEHGYAATSVREIARNLGVSHNLIPQRYGSKERLWYTAVDYGFATVLAELLPVLNEPLPDDVTRLRALIVRFVEVNTARPALLRIINREAASPSARFDYLFERYIEPVAGLGAGILDDLQAKGQLTGSSVTLLYFFMTHGAGGPAMFPALAERLGEPVVRDDPEAVRAFAESAVEVLFDGLRGSAPRTRTRGSN